PQPRRDARREAVGADEQYIRGTAIQLNDRSVVADDPSGVIEGLCDQVVHFILTQVGQLVHCLIFFLVSRIETTSATSLNASSGFLPSKPASPRCLSESKLTVPVGCRPPGGTSGNATTDRTSLQTVATWAPEPSRPRSPSVMFPNAHRLLA